MSYLTLIQISLLLSSVCAWENLPSIPSGRRAQFLVLGDDGGYKFGYDTGSGAAAKQEADPSNQVQGHYFYTAPTGQQIDLKYTSGVQGFVPENLNQIQELLQKSAPSAHVPYSSSPPNPSDASGDYVPDNSGDYVPDNSGDYKGDDSASYNPQEADTGDASYNFNIDTPSYKRIESSDARGNIQGSYSYTNQEGTHDLQYIAGSGTGFVTKSGSLALPNGLKNQNLVPTTYHQQPTYGGGVEAQGAQGAVNPDGSYSFGFSSNDQSRQESGDANGNVHGSFSYKNAEGNHDLTYVAGSATGFQPTGGSLSNPNGLAGAPYSQNPSSSGAEVVAARSSPQSDASYDFSFDTGDYKRQEASDGNGNVRGSYSYSNSVGQHDLSFVAGSGTGFLPTGGSLSVAPGASEAQLRSGASGGGGETFPAQSGRNVYLPPSSLPLQNTNSHDLSETSYSLGNAKVNLYLTPNNAKHKTGYILNF